MTIALLIKGKVQGVFYRKLARDKALQLGLTGWIKNCSNGDVQAMATGTADALEEFISWCKIGPPNANVRSVEVEDNVGAEAFSSFTILKEL